MNILHNLEFEDIKLITGSSSGKALGYGLDGLGSIPGIEGVEIFLTPSCPD